MTEDERDDLADQFPKGMIIWEDDEELNGWPDDPWTLAKWERVMKEDPKGPDGQGWLYLFFNAMTSSVLREADKLDRLK